MNIRHTRPAAPAAGRFPRVPALGRGAGALVLLPLLVLVFLLVPAAPARAHATLVSSSPADGAVVASAPVRVRLTFDEAVRPVAGAVRVLDPAGRNAGGAVTGGGTVVTVALTAATAPGTYTVSWRVISADSHPVDGTITFSVGHPSRPAAAHARGTDTAVSVAFAVARFLAFAGFALLVGVVAFCCYGFPYGAALRGPRVLAVGGWALLAAGSFGALLLEGPYGAGAGLSGLVRPELLRRTLSTTYGEALTVRIVLAGTVPALLAYWLSRAGTTGRTGRAVFGGIWAVPAAAMAVTWPLGGHAATGSQRVLAVGADTAHLCAMALWLGGLAAVLAIARPSPRAPGPAPGAARSSPQVPEPTAGVARSSPTAPDPAAGVARFSVVAAGCVAVLVATGLYQAWLRVATLDALFTTRYGVTLVVKVALVAAVAGVAFFSRRAVRRGRAAGTPVRTLRRLVATEIAGTAAVLAVTALLVAMDPAGKALAARPVTLTGRYGTQGSGPGGTVGVRLPERARGLTRATVVVRDAAGTPRDVPEVDVAWSLPARGIGPIRARVTRLGTGRYAAVTPPIPATGRWRIAVTVRTGEIDETTVLLSQTLR